MRILIAGHGIVFPKPRRKGRPWPPLIWSWSIHPWTLYLSHLRPISITLLVLGRDLTIPKLLDGLGKLCGFLDHDQLVGDVGQIHNPKISIDFYAQTAQPFIRPSSP